MAGRTGLRAPKEIASALGETIGPRQISRARSSQLEVALDLKLEVDAADRYNRLRRQAWPILQLSFRDGIAHRLLDLPLGGYAKRLEKFSHAGVKGFLVHDRSFVGRLVWPVIRYCCSEAIADLHPSSRCRPPL